MYSVYRHPPTRNYHVGTYRDYNNAKLQAIRISKQYKDQYVVIRNAANIRIASYMNGNYQ